MNERRKSSEEKGETPWRKPVRPGAYGPERISVAGGNIPAPGLGKLGARLIWFHAELNVKSTLRESTY